MKEYDFVFSLGFSCGTSQALRAAGLQFASYPLDWVGAHDILCSVQAVETDFVGWLDADDLELSDVRHGVGFLTRAYLNRRTQIGFSHEFSDFQPFATMLPKVRDSYERRADRFRETLRMSRRILAVWAEPPMNVAPAMSAYREALSRLRAKLAPAEVDLIAFFESPGCGAPHETASGEGLTVVAADYRKMDGGVLTHFVDFQQFEAYLRPRVSTRDPRTEEERKSYARSTRTNSTLRWGADKTRFRRWLNQRAYKLYRHLERVLQRRGLVQTEGPLWFWEDLRQAAEAVK